MGFWIKNSARMSTVLKNSILLRVFVDELEIASVNIPLRRDLNYDGPVNSWYPVNDGKGRVNCTVNYAVGTI
jgi:hypothetical protein